MLSSAEVQQHIKTLPQCALNSRSELKVFEWQYFYMHGDLLIHFAGLRPFQKLHLMQNFMEGTYYRDRAIHVT